jgi:hypothetical protein
MPQLSLTTRRKNAREHTRLLKGSLRIRIKQELRAPANRQKTTKSWLRFGEAYSALRGWRPIPAALLSHSVYFVPGRKNFPSN